jgi:hypothetical protein
MTHAQIVHVALARPDDPPPPPRLARLVRDAWVLYPGDVEAVVRHMTPIIEADEEFTAWMLMKWERDFIKEARAARDN